MGIWSYLSKEKNNFSLSLLMIFSELAEMFSIAAVIPFLGY